MYAIPGQHDMPLHNMDLLRKSAFFTLVQAGVVHQLEYGLPQTVSRKLTLHGVPWGSMIKPPEGEYAAEGVFNLLVAHQYIWVNGKSYPGALQEQNWDSKKKLMRGYDAAVFGDNHKGFQAARNVLNCGTLLRRKTDEASYKPMIGLLRQSGTIEPLFLDTTLDVLEATDEKRKAETNVEMEEFLKGLVGLQETRLDFVEAMKIVLEEKQPSALVRQYIMEAMDNG